MAEPGKLASIPEAIIAASRDAFLILSKEGLILSYNQAALRLLNVPGEALADTHFIDVVRIHNAPFDRHAVMKAAESPILGEIERADGDAVSVELSIFSLEAQGHSLIAVQLRDISTETGVQSELHRLAYFDRVTQLPNRIATMNHLEERIAAEAEFTVLHFNLDRFRILKNSLGHRFADRILIALAERLQTMLAGEIWLSRLANDEFIIVLEKHDRETLKTVTSTIQAALSRDFVVDGRDIHLTASIGVVHVAQDYEDPVEILSDAEIAAFQAKIAGGATFAVFDQPMREVLEDLQSTEAALRLAVQDNKQISVAYQPIVDLQTGTLVGFEALARWDHPERGRISPVEFIPIAEATGLIVPIGADILAQALLEARRWAKIVGAENAPFISVNMSLRQLAEGHFIEDTKRLLAETGINPSKLKLEITESMLMTDPEESIRKLQELRNLGLELSIDDFGTGYSSLAYLHRLPVKNLKIDRSFVIRIGEPNDREIVRIISELSSILGLEVVAEGVETREDVAILQGLGCTYGQGYYFSRPVPASEAEKLIKMQTPPWITGNLFG
jgi:diguanylate cyclase (GGDEF)-like protein